MKIWLCFFCESPVNEIGAFVKLAATRYAHLICYDHRHALQVRADDAASRAQKLEEDALRHTNDAVAVWRAAPRCPKCGVPMLPERPAALPAEFSTVLLGSGGVCGPCVRQEASLRASARALTQRVEVPVRAASAQSPTNAEDEALLRKARETGNPTIEVE